MGIGSQEHIDLMAFFDRMNGHLRLDKESKEMWTKKRIYQDGQVNDLFLMFRSGVEFGRVYFREKLTSPSSEGPLTRESVTSQTEEGSQRGSS